MRVNLILFFARKFSYRNACHSEQKLTTSYGVAININDHFTIKTEEKGRNLEMITSLKDNWINSNNRANEITEEIWKIVSL